MLKLSTVALLLLLAGCATSGREITQSQMDQIVEGQTTRSDLIAMLGQPNSVTRNHDGTHVLGWGYAHVGFMGIGTRIQGFSVILGPDGTVQGYSRTDSGYPGAR